MIATEARFERAVFAPVEAAASQLIVPAVFVRTLVSVVEVTAERVSRVFAARTEPAAMVERFVPPFATPIAVAFQDPVATVPRVVRLVEPAQVVRAVFSTLPRPTSVFVTVSQAGAAEAAPSPVSRRNLRVVVAFPARAERVFAAEA